MRARWYNPWLCRFISEDPIQFKGGMNWYAYAGGDPVMSLDPSGLKDYKVVYYDGGDPGGPNLLDGVGWKWVAETLVANKYADMAIDARTQEAVAAHANLLGTNGDRISGVGFADHGVAYTRGTFEPVRVQTFGTNGDRLGKPMLDAVIGAGTPDMRVTFYGCSVAAGNSGRVGLQGLARSYPGHQFVAPATDLVVQPSKTAARMNYMAPTDQSNVFMIGATYPAAGQNLVTNNYGNLSLLGGPYTSSSSRPRSGGK